MGALLTELLCAQACAPLHLWWELEWTELHTPGMSIAYPRLNWLRGRESVLIRSVRHTRRNALTCWVDYDPLIGARGKSSRRVCQAVPKAGSAEAILLGS